MGFHQEMEEHVVGECETPTMLKSSYQFVRCLGEGAQGRTYLAEKKDTGELVAVKELKMNTADAFKGFELFMRESEVLADLDDPGVPKFYERIIPKDGNGSCYIVQEFCQNPSIQSTLDLNVRNAKKCFSVTDVLKVIKCTAEILERLEKNYTPPIVHRDIKPSNILYSKVQGEIRCWLIDFGAVANPQKRSSSSTIAGTCGYMAPEQLMGMCTPASDIYSLGMTAVHMLTEEPPWKMPVEGLKIQYEPILRKVRPDLNDSVLNLLRMMTDASLDNRIGSASEILDFLEKIKGTIEQKEQQDKIIPLNRMKYFIVHHPFLFCIRTFFDTFIRTFSAFIIIMVIIMVIIVITVEWTSQDMQFEPLILMLMLASIYYSLFISSVLALKICVSTLIERKHWQWQDKLYHIAQELNHDKLKNNEEFGHLEGIGVAGIVQTEAIVENVSPVASSKNKYVVDYIYMVNKVYYSGVEVRVVNPDEVLKRGNRIKVLVNKRLHQIKKEDC